MMTMGMTTHISDGDLVRILDHEVSTREQDRAQAHIEECEDCSERMQLIARRFHDLTSLLSAAMAEIPPVPISPDRLDRSRTAAARDGWPVPASQWMRAAAVILLLLAAGVIASPARARISSWAEQGWNSLASVWQTEAPGRGIASSDQAGTRVQFTPVGDTFTLNFVSSQTAGSVLIQKAAVSVATAEVTGSSAHPELLVLPAGVEVRNNPQSIAEYQVIVPEFVETVTLRIDGADPMTITGSHLLSGARVTLAGLGTDS